ncbi:MAG TPA: cation-transporting P-type ATPase [Mycobacterium sp.]|nr:cation-transporting P-type ATPase [Mycobacterium sp.]
MSTRDDRPTTDARAADGLPIHALEVAAAFEAAGSSPRGLTTTEIETRLARFGPNSLPPPPRRPLWLRFLAQFTDLFAIVLLVAAAITFAIYLLQHPRDIGNIQLAVAILCVVLLNAVIGFAQEYTAERTAQALQAMVPRTCRVLRDGARQEAPVSDLVPGDLVLLEPGDAVPADCRLTEARSLSVDNAALTGESAPVVRVADAVRPDAPELEARNLVFMGTSVATGTGKALVARTGPATQFGRIFGLTMAAPAPRSPLQRQVAAMARRVSAAAIGIGGLVFVLRMPGHPLVQSFVFALGVMVALVPEGLPATLSVSLAVGVRRMAAHHAVVKQLLAVEALGSTTVICTDKTGTLTQAEMTVAQVWSAGDMHGVSGVGYAPEGAVEEAGAVRPLLRIAALCSNARLLPPTDHEPWRVLGDTTEGALLVAAGKAGIDLAQAERDTRRLMEFPFDSARKLMTTVHRVPGGYAAFVKGAPQEVLSRCVAADWLGETRLLDDGLRTVIADANDEMARTGLRVLAVAQRRVDGPDAAQGDAESGLTLHGLVGMLDPPRPEVTDAVRACRQAGIRIVMITGDYALTAEAVARRVGIVHAAAPRVLIGAQLTELDDAALDQILAEPGELLFCRVNPEHKMRVVAALQRAGEVVAVTGDGANDAPALKHADIGVAMGRSGTDVAREAAVMVLLDDSFAAIAAAVRLGRSVYQNIRKFLIYLFSHNIGELVPILVATFVGFPLVPLTAVQILAIDLGSDVLPALALGAQPPEPDVMEHTPRRRDEPLFSATVVRRFLFLGLIQAVGASIAFFWIIHASGLPFSAFATTTPDYREAITMTQASIVVSQFFNGLAVQSDRQSIFRLGIFSNPRLLAAECIGIGIMAAISYVPALQSVFHTAALTPADWLILIAFGLLLLVADETRKWLLRRHDARRQPGGAR